jgi:glucose/arabinose dehydrogenase
MAQPSPVSRVRTLIVANVVGVSVLSAVLGAPVVSGYVVQLEESLRFPEPEVGKPVQVELFAAGFEQPVGIVPRGDRLLVAERTGRVRDVFTREVVLDVRDRISTDGEGGLLGLATGGESMWLFYTDQSGDLVIARDGTGVLHIDHPADVHNGGSLAFGPDGYLYASVGDGSVTDDELGFGTEPDDYLGAILRLDPRSGITDVWAHGLRNPWRMSFDPIGNLWVGDAGQNEIEEIDRLPVGERGHDFGWSRWEGRQCFAATECDKVGVTMPVVEYRRKDGDCAVIGGYVYRGADIPALIGRYVFGDFCSGHIWSVDAASPGRRRLEATAGSLMTSFAESASGELYVLQYDGTIGRLVGR